MGCRCIVLGFHVFTNPLHRGPGTPLHIEERGRSFGRSPLAEFGIGFRSFAGDAVGCCVGRAWPVCVSGGFGRDREQLVFTGQTEAGLVVKIHLDITVYDVRYRIIFIK